MGRKKSVAAEKGAARVRVCTACNITIASQEKSLPLDGAEIHLRCQSRVIFKERGGLCKILSSLPEKFCLSHWAEKMTERIFQVRTLKSLEETLWQIGDDLLTFLEVPCVRKIKNALKRAIKWLGQLSERIFFWKPAWAM